MVKQLTCVVAAHKYGCAVSFSRNTYVIHNVLTIMPCYEYVLVFVNNVTVKSSLATNSVLIPHILQPSARL